MLSADAALVFDRHPTVVVMVKQRESDLDVGGADPGVERGERRVGRLAAFQQTRGRVDGEQLSNPVDR